MQKSLPSPLKKYFTTPIISLVWTAFGELLVYFFAFLLPFNLLKLYDQPRLDQHLLFGRGTSAYIGLVVGFIAAWGVYLLGYRISLNLGRDPQKAKGQKTAWMIVLGGMAAFILIFLFVAPFDAADIYDNIMHGRILGVHLANPFQQVTAAYPDDPFYEYVAWKKAVSAYGPLWEALAGLTARLAGDGIIANVLAFKFLPGIFHLAGVALVALYLKREAPEHALSGTLLLAWNPLVLYETWGNGHNDTALAFWLILAAWWVLRQRYTLAVLALLLGALMKFLPILVVPALLWIAWQNLGSFGARVKYLLRTGILALLITLAAYLPFWNGVASLSVGRRMGMFTTSIPSAIYYNIKSALGADEASRLVSLVALGLLAVFVLWQSLRAKTPSDFLQIAFNILIFYLLVTCLWFQQWYCVWLIFLAPLLPPLSRNLALVFGFWAASKQAVFGPIFVSTMYWHPTTQPRLEPLFVLSVLGVPWLYALWTLFQGKKYHAKT